MNMSAHYDKITGYGFKFLNPYGATEYNGVETIYPLPKGNEKWGPWFEHPNPAKFNGEECGPGGWHVMKNLSADCSPTDWWVWFVQWRGLIGQGNEKIRVAEVRLRRIDKRTFWKIIRMGYCRGANLRGVHLQLADLHGADLRGVNLQKADLYMVTLQDSNLARADLIKVDLRYANLQNIKLQRSKLYWADLYEANLQDADLCKATFIEANLRNADLRGANLQGANLRDVQLYGAKYNKCTKLPCDVNTYGMALIE